MPDCVEGTDQALERREILVRRYRCVVCKKTMTVVPAEVRFGTDFLTSSVVLALALWVFHPEGLSAEAVRRLLCAGSSRGVSGWRQLRRWASSNELPGAETVDPWLAPRRRAAEIIRILAARAPPHTRGEPLSVRALRAVIGHRI